MEQLRRVTGSQRKALSIAGVARSSWYYRHQPRPRVSAPVPHRDRRCRWRISVEDRERIQGYILTGWAKGVSVDHSFAQAWDQGVMLGSRRSWWRIAKQLDQRLRPVIPVRRKHPQPRQKPVVSAIRPGQAWSWDITDLLTPWRGVRFKAYKITDIYSREIVGFRVEERESDHLAQQMFTTAMGAHGVPEVVHADSGAAMVSNTLRQLLSGHLVRLSFNRPYVSNDNPFSEAGFKTMKYRPGYPRVFTTLAEARAYISDYVTWYNTTHKHSGIALFTPQQVSNGTWQQAWNARDHTLQNYYHRHPQRFQRPPKTPQPAPQVGINLDTEAKPINTA